MNVNPNEPALDGQRLQRRPIVLPAAVRVWAFTVGLAILAIVLDFGVVEPRAVGPGPLQIPWPLIAAGFCLAELKVVDVHFRREQHSFSLSEFPIVIGLFFLEPSTYLVALLLGSGVALAIQSRGNHPVKLAFNMADVGGEAERIPTRACRTVGAGSCARAANVHAAVAPPSSVMNSRRSIIR